MRQILNTAYAALAENLDSQRIAELDFELRAPFPWELDDEERKREEYRRRAVEIGAHRGQQSLMELMGMSQLGAGEMAPDGPSRGAA